jgi:casein kinase II subunit alpha
MHRDVEPHYIMIYHERRTLRPIDWGSAEFYHPGTEYKVRVALQCFQGPEILVDLQMYDYSLELWSPGDMLAYIFSKRSTFRGNSNTDQLVKIAKVLGTEELLECLSKYHLVLESQYTRFWVLVPTQAWEENLENQNLVTPEAIDCIDRISRYDHQERLTAKESMSNPYSDPVRQKDGYLSHCYDKSVNIVLMHTCS